MQGHEGSSLDSQLDLIAFYADDAAFVIAVTSLTGAACHLIALVEQCFCQDIYLFFTAHRKGYVDEACPVQCLRAVLHMGFVHDF